MNHLKFLTGIDNDEKRFANGLWSPEMICTQLWLAYNALHRIPGIPLPACVATHCKRAAIMIPRSLHEKWAGEYRSIKGTNCFYCLGPRECEDHFVPVVVAAYTEIPKYLKVKIPSCISCNAIAGAKFFKTFEEKQAYILSRREQCSDDKQIAAWNAERASMFVESGNGSALIYVESHIILESIERRAKPGVERKLVNQGIKMIKSWNKLLAIDWLYTFRSELAFNENAEDYLNILRNRLMQLALGVIPDPSAE